MGFSTENLITVMCASIPEYVAFYLKQMYIENSAFSPKNNM